MSKVKDQLLEDEKKQWKDADEAYAFEQFKKHLLWAEGIVSFAVENGSVEAYDLSDQEVIDLAEEIINQGDLAYDSWKEENHS